MRELPGKGAEILLFLAGPNQALSGLHPRRGGAVQRQGLFLVLRFKLRQLSPKPQTERVLHDPLPPQIIQGGAGIVPCAAPQKQLHNYHAGGVQRGPYPGSAGPAAGSPAEPAEAAAEGQSAACPGRAVFQAVRQCGRCVPDGGREGSPGGVSRRHPAPGPSTGARAWVWPSQSGMWT